MWTAVIQAQPAYLRSLFQADGTVRLRRRERPLRKSDIVLTTTSQPLAQGIQSLLLNLGIYSRILRGVEKRENRRGPSLFLVGWLEATDPIQEVIWVVLGNK